MSQIMGKRRGQYINRRIIGKLKKVRQRTLHRIMCSSFMCGSRGGTEGLPPEKSQNIGFSSNTGLDPLINRSYQASIQCWAIIGLAAKRHFMAFCWRAGDGPLIVVHGSPSPHQLKKKRCQSKTPSDKAFWIRAY